MIRGIFGVIAAGALAGGALQGTSGAAAVAGPRTYTTRLVARTTARTIELRGSGQNLHLASVTVDGRQLAFGDGGGSETATMYGDGVIVRFTQHGDAYAASVVAIAGRPEIVVRYSIGR